MSHRSLFEVPSPGAYMLSHSVGCLPRATRQLFDRDMLGTWSAQGSDGWPAWLEAVDRFRTQLAAIFAVQASEICPQPSVSAALGSLLSGLRREPGRNVLLASAHSFPSIGFALGQFERLGYRLELIPEDQNPSLPETWVARINPQVAAVVAMHVHSNIGVVAPVREIADAARSAGALAVLDVCQSGGILPINLAASGMDAAIGSCVKWLCGGPGAGYLWVREKLIAGMEPVNVGWFSHESPFEFDIRDFRYANDARRFWGGTPSVAPFVLATGGIATIADIGVDTILAHNRAFVEAFAAAADVRLNMQQRGGTLCLTAPNMEAVAARLTGLSCRFDQRGPVLRLSPHIFNEMGEATELGTALRGCGVGLI